MNEITQSQGLIHLDANLKSRAASEFERRLGTMVIGQFRAIEGIVSLYQILHAGMSDARRPLGTMLFLGPTGSGKTHVVESAAEILFGNPNALIKIDCAEYQHHHEISRLIGAPPGYLGHRETPPVLTQQRLNQCSTEREPFSLVLFDEIEKASEALWQLLLGILDKATMTLGDNTEVDFSRTMIFMTSNLGAREISDLMTGTIGFAPAQAESIEPEELSSKIDRTATEAARRNFSPEFMNRIDKVVVFHSLGHEQLRNVLELELSRVQRRIDRGSGQRFGIQLTAKAKEFLLDEGVNRSYGARHLKRAIERLLVSPLANLSATNQARHGDAILVDFDDSTQQLEFYRDEAQQQAMTVGAPSKARSTRKRTWIDFSQTPVKAIG